MSAERPEKRIVLYIPIPSYESQERVWSKGLNFLVFTHGFVGPNQIAVNWSHDDNGI